ncbi:MAG: hypothetical protein NZ602_01845 [Thermoguttaceae bacterium]|nr:hypothetical protein [Thermoguttaceae bacterium]MDW8036801.1 hypothetical protein [Thermoguttaceae bacterium]
MQESFDPYAVFLGFPVGQPPKNYYELLGLPLGESDPEKISAAVERLRNQVRHIRPGAYLAQWQQLLDELTAAKICLLDPVAKSLYDESLQKGQPSSPSGSGTLFAPSGEPTPHGTPEAPGGIPPGPVSSAPPRQQTPQEAATPAPGYFPSGIPITNPQAQMPPMGETQKMLTGEVSPVGYCLPPSGSGPPPQYAYSEGAFPHQFGGYHPGQVHPHGIPWGIPITPPVGHPYSTTSGVGSSGSTALPSFAAQQGGIYPRAQLLPPMPSGNIPPSGPAAGAHLIPDPLPGATTQIAIKKAPLQARQSVVWWMASCVVLILLALGLFFLFYRVRMQWPEAAVPKTSAGNQSSWNQMPSDPSSGKSVSGTFARNGQPKGSTSPAEKSSPPGEEREKHGGGISDQNSLKPGEKRPLQPKPSLDPAKQAAWEKAVQEVRSALAEHDLASAAEALKTAETNAQTPEQHEVVERLRMLEHYLGEFWKGIRQSVSSLQVAQEFTVGNIRFAIVEGNSQYLIVRAEGRNIRWPIEKIPGSVVELLARRWFRTNHPATQLAFGAYYAVRGETQRARQYWEQAGKSGGVDVNGLLEELRNWPLSQPPPPEGQSPLQ